MLGRGAIILGNYLVGLADQFILLQQDVVITGTAPDDKKGVLMEITGKVSQSLLYESSERFTAP